MNEALLKRIGLWLVSWVLASGLVAGESRNLFADEPADSGVVTDRVDSFAIHEAARRRDIQRQLDLISEMKWFAGLPTNRPKLVYHAPSLESIYGGFVGGYRGYGSLMTFEPWPYVPGDIWGYSYVNPVPQPIGQRQVQTGPGRWESYPVYVQPPRPYPRPGQPGAPEEVPPGRSAGPREF